MTYVKDYMTPKRPTTGCPGFRVTSCASVWDQYRIYLIVSGSDSYFNRLDIFYIPGTYMAGSAGLHGIVWPYRPPGDGRLTSKINVPAIDTS